MKRASLVIFSIFLILFILGSCSSNPTVTRVDAGTTIDLSGRWNDTDARIVSQSLIRDCLDAPRVNAFVNQFMMANNGRLPAVLVGTFRNETSEHIDTGLIARNLEMAITNSGRMTFVAGGDILNELRAERVGQLEFASEETMLRMANETGAVLLLTGTVRSIVDRAGRDTVRSYFVNAELTNIETRERIWMGSNDEIKKTIRQSNNRL